MRSLNTRIVWYWTAYCIVGCSLLPELLISARYLPTRRSTPTQLERNERMRELFQHILESERDAHLSAANKFADQLKLIQKKSNDFGQLPEPIRDYNDELGDEYDERLERSQYAVKRAHFPQREKQPWRFVLLNYGHGAHRNNHKLDATNSNAKDVQSGLSAIGSNADDMVSLNAPRSQQLMPKLYREKQQKSSTANTNADASETTSDLDWITSNSDLNSATDYDALYDDVNEKRSSSSNLKFDRYRRNGGPLAQHKEHLN